MALPSWAFIGVGVVVTYVSYVLGDKYDLFFYVGLLFLVWGLFKLVLNYVMKSPSKVEEKAVERRMEPNVIACPYCASSCYSSARFCHMCGGKLRA
ncbi:MAG: hypothetical protein ACE5FT_06415 [Candidatus Nanoarchaeia archaeon]